MDWYGSYFQLCVIFFQFNVIWNVGEPEVEDEFRSLAVKFNEDNGVKAEVE